MPDQTASVPVENRAAAPDASDAGSAGRGDSGAELKRLNLSLKAQSRSARAMMRAANEADYAQEVCRIVAEDCGRALVWIGLAQDDAEKTIRPAAYAGFEAGYLEKLRLTWADTERGRGPTGTAVRTGKPCLCRDMLTDPHFAPWRAEALKRGYASSLALPLTARGKTFGALTVYEREPDGFSAHEVELLSDLADDLAFGIASLRLREEHARMEEELRSLALFPAENPGPVMRVSKDSTLLYANKAAEPLVACWGCRVGGPAPEPLNRCVRQALDLGASQETELECCGRAFSMVFAPISDRGYVTLYGLDVTERKRLEEEVLRSRDELDARVRERTREVVETLERLRESQRLIQQIADTTPDIIYIFDCARLQMIYANRRAAEFAGYTSANLEEPSVRLIEEWIHPDDQYCVRKARDLLSAPDARDFIEYECRAKRADGQWRRLLVRETLFTRGQAGLREGILGVAVDITERQSALAALAESEAKFRAIFDNAFQFIALIRPDGTTLDVNRTALRFAGIALPEAAGRPLWETSWWRSSPAEQKQLKEAVAKAAAGRFARYETVLRGAGEAVIAADFSVSPVPGADGGTPLLIVEARDITERKRLEHELLEISSAERRRFGQDLHDGLGQQLAGIALLSRALEQRLTARNAAAAKAARTIGDLANQAATQSRALARGLSPVDLREDGLADALRELAANTEAVFGIQCKFVCETPASVAGSAVATNLYYIALEAVNNAVKHSRADTITVSLSGGPEAVSVRVRDNGVGLPEQAERADGLGLRTMRYRADTIGALLDIRRLPPRGTIVRCCLRRPKAGPASKAEAP